MNRYLGQFKDLKDNTITVEIVPSNGSYSDTIDIRFVGDEPIIITQESEKLFDGIKPKSCTIKLFTEDIYWDLYSPSSVGYHVKVDCEIKDSEGEKEKLFRGYLTPCIYTQDYAYKAEIELEAVDYLAVLDTFTYKVDGDKEIVSIDTLLSKLFSNIPNYESYLNFTDIDFQTYYVQEANFFDDDDEPMKCQDILRELMNYFGFTAVMIADSISIIEYKSNSNGEQLDIKKYGEGTPSIELDEVYNKITIGCNLYEVDDIVDEIFDEDNKTVVNEVKLTSDGKQLFSDFGFSWREHGHHTTDNHRYTMYVKPYHFVDETLEDGKNYRTSRWSTYHRLISNNQLTSNSISLVAWNDTRSYIDNGGNHLFIPRYRAAYPIRQYSFSKAEGIESKSKINWNEYILFPTFDDETESERRRTNYPALTFKNDENLAYSISGGTGYLVFNADLWCQSDIGNEGVDTDIIWTYAFKGGKEYRVPMPICMENMDLTFPSNIRRAEERSSSTAGYNEGWDMVQAKVKIGDKYWNGYSWTTTESTFMLKYHDDDVSGDDETLNYFTWLKVAPNPNIPKINVGDDGYAIPITASDYLHGKLEFTLYTPNQLNRSINNFFMRDLSFKYVYKDSQNWADDKKIEDDIIYENIINEDWATEMEELDLKINSWYKDKPISKSYILDNNLLPVIEINGKVQESRLLEKYYNHYSTPKKIFNLNYKVRDINPTKTYYHLQTETIYCIDSFECNVKTGETNLKLIEL